LQVRIARIHRKKNDFIHGGSIPGRHDVLTRDHEARRVGVEMAVDAKKTLAVGWRTGFVVMLAQTGSPSRARPETVGIF
jgi:hypothetical protein